MQPTVGRPVHYLLCRDDIDRITAQLSSNPPELLEQFNPPRLRQTYAATITAVDTEHSEVNLRVTLDGPYDYYAPSRREGTGPGTWSWPPRIGG